MPNEYKPFYFADLKATINETALETMLPPDVFEENIDTLRSALIATYNDGIRTFADMLIEKLAEGSKE